MRRVRWLTVIVPAAVIGGYVFVARPLFDRIYDLPAASFIVVGLGVAAAYFFSKVVFDHIAGLQGSLEERNKALAVLYAVAAKTASSLRSGHVAELAMDQTIASLGATAGAIYLVDQDGDELVLEVYRGANGKAAPQATAEVDDCGCAKVLRQRAPLTLGAQAAECRSVVDEAGGPARCISVPLVSGDRALGAMFVVLSDPLPFGSQTVDVLVAIGQQIGAALETARLHEATETVAVLQERNRVAMELHDGLAQVVGAIALKAQVVQGRLAQGDLPMAERELVGLRAAASEAFRDVREAILDLRISIGPARSFFDTLREYVRRFSAQNKVPVELDLPKGDPFPLSPATQVQILRIVQEALNNVRKHAPLSQAAVTFTAEDGRVRIAVEDDGPGFDPSKVVKGKQMGLESMAERTKSVGGDFRLETTLGKGTKVIVTLPKDDQDARQTA